MLSPEEIRAIEEEAPRYRDRQALGIEALKIVQRHRGWIPDEALAAVADYLGLPREHLEGVATFYNLLFRKPVGRHIIRLCDSVSCWLTGQETVCRALCGEHGLTMGGTTADGRFTLVTVPCLGACDRGPVMLVDEDLVGPLQPESLGPILGRYE
ncbi:MAG: NADH-quinone oxidoreductase, subunit [Rhodocyclaceae bacterium]|nr:NADH-quinone oxidoreductase, subunit [Rhodocyclaceae bacterium]